MTSCLGQTTLTKLPSGICALPSMLGFVPKGIYRGVSKWRNPELQPRPNWPLLLSPELLWAVHHLPCLCSRRVVSRKIIAAYAAEQQFPTGRDPISRSYYVPVAFSVSQCNQPVPARLAPPVCGDTSFLPPIALTAPASHRS